MSHSIIYHVLPREMWVGISLRSIFCCNVHESFSNPNPIWLPLRKPHVRKAPWSQPSTQADVKKKKKKKYLKKMMEFPNLILAPLNLKNLLGLSSIVENLAGITKSKAIHISCAVIYSLLGSSALLTLQILKWGINGNFNIRNLSQPFPCNSFSSGWLYFQLLRNKTAPYPPVQFLFQSVIIPATP